MASFIYNKAKEQLLNGTLDLVADPIYAVLVTGGYTPNPDHDFVSSVGANELSGTGYSRKLLTSKSVTEVDSSDRAEFTADNLQWTAINAGTASGVVLYKRVGASDNAAADVLIAHIDSGGFPVVTNGGDLNINWNASGIIQLA
jgi:hypothetical protein